MRERARAAYPARLEAALAVASAILLILSFPNFNLWPLAWVGLVPLFVAVCRRPHEARAFLLGLITGTLFFFGSCYWLTYAMVRYGHIPIWIAYPLLIPGAFVLAIFPALCCLLLARMIIRRGAAALLLAPIFWAALEWGRLAVTGQLWNAIGYSQAYVPPLIQSARWAGVYGVGFLIVMVNAAVGYLVVKRTTRALLAALLYVVCAAVLIVSSNHNSLVDTPPTSSSSAPDVIAVAVQPNVPMEPVEDLAEADALVARHKELGTGALRTWELEGKLNTPVSDNNQATAMTTDSRRAIPRVVVWPESPMNFTYANDTALREWVARFATENRTSVLFNSLEPAPAAGAYNSAVMVNEEGRKVAQYDKIRLLPFGEYVPLPRWLPGVNLVPVMVGDFTPGADYPLMPLGANMRAGVYICFESAFPSISREFAARGADVLINISNDGYLGPTPVMRQHLANTIFRAVEVGRPTLRVTNTGITAYITPRGEVIGATEGFTPQVRVWAISRAAPAQTFYTKYGELFVAACAVVSVLLFLTTLKKSRVKGRKEIAFDSRL
jgi:apolipoprotein N-acyltransferase